MRPVLCGFSTRLGQSGCSIAAIDGARYELEAVCATTGFGYDAPAADVTQKTWLLFIQYMLAAEKSLGHAPRTVRFDRAPNLEIVLPFERSWSP